MGVFELICDHCEDSIDGFDEFDDAVKHKMTNGWNLLKGSLGHGTNCAGSVQLRSGYRSTGEDE
jgi:hypothetical protein